jgi:SnoaL-like domain
MSEDEVAVARRLMELLTGDSPEQALEYVHPQATFDTTVRPDGKVWAGRAGVGQAMAEWMGSWTDWSLEVEDYRAVGDGRVVVLWQESGRARGSDLVMSQIGATVFTIQDGTVIAAIVSVDAQGTLADLGLAE